MSCPLTSSCSSYYSESVISSDKSFIYSLFTYGYYNSIKYLYFVCFNSLDGSILSSRYKSSIQVDSDVYSIVIYGDYVISITGSYLVMYSITTFAFTIKKFNGHLLFSMLLDPSSGR